MRFGTSAGVRLAERLIAVSISDLTYSTFSSLVVYDTITHKIS